MVCMFFNTFKYGNCMKFLLLFGVFSFSHFSQTFYVKSPNAVFLKEAKTDSDKFFSIPQGKEIQAIESKGLFVLVNYQGKLGYISKLSLSALPPSESGPILRNDLSSKPNLRDRPSDFSHTLASRGLVGSESLEEAQVTQKGRDAFEWLESILSE